MVVCCSSNKQGCPASITLSGQAVEGKLVVSAVNLDHSCSVATHYHAYPEVRTDLPQAAQELMDNLLKFNVSASEVAIYLRAKGASNITLKDIANWRQRLRNENGQETEMQVPLHSGQLLCRMHGK